MKNIKCYLIIAILSISFTSCLKSGLKDLPAFSQAEITKFRFEYRWFDQTAQQLMVVQIATIATIDAASNTVNCKLTVPAASGTFTTAVRNEVTLSNIVGYADISNAATMITVGSTPQLGKVADFSKTNMQYQVTAADGNSKKVWNLVITDFIK